MFPFADSSPDFAADEAAGAPADAADGVARKPSAVPSSGTRSRSTLGTAPHEGVPEIVVVIAWAIEEIE